MKHIIQLIVAILALFPYFASAQTKIEHTPFGYGVYDEGTSKWIIKNRYDRIKAVYDAVFKEDVLYACQKEGKYAIFSRDGKRLTFFAFDDVRSRKYDNLIPVKQNNVWGLINTRGYVVMPFQYRAIVPNKENIGYNLPNEDVPVHIQIYRVRFMERSAEQKNNMYQYDAELNKKISEILSTPTSEGKSSAKTLSEGNFTNSLSVNDPHHVYLGYCKNGVFAVRDNDSRKTYLFTKEGKKISEINIANTDNIWFSEDGRAVVWIEDGVAGVINLTGEVVKNLGNVSSISPFVDGIAFYSTLQGGSVVYHFINTDGIEVYKDLARKYTENKITPVLNHIKDDRRLYVDKTGHGYIDSKGTIAIAGNYPKAHDFSEGLAAVAQRNGNILLWGFIDKNGNMVITPKFSNEPRDFNDGYARVQKKDGMYCFINMSGEVCSDNYTAASDFYMGYAFAQLPDKRKVVIDNNFKIVKETDCQGWYCSRADGMLFGQDYIYSLDGDPIVFLGFFNSFDKFYEGISRATGKGYINNRGEWILKLVKNEF